MTIQNSLYRRTLSTIRRATVAEPVNQPFQTHLSSATTRFRNERSTNNSTTMTTSNDMAHHERRNNEEGNENSRKNVYRIGGRIERKSS